MTSQINTSFPVYGIPTTSSVRQNFAYAKSEIEALQSVSINVKILFGAVGNGIADDTLAINNAYTFAASFGGVVLFPPGRYKISGTINTQGVTTVGSGPTTSVIVRGDNTNLNTMMLIQNKSNFQMRDFGLDGNKANNTIEANNVTLDACSDYVFENVYSKNAYSFAPTDGSQSDPLTGNGIFLVNTAYPYYDPNSLSNPYPSTVPADWLIRAFINCQCCENSHNGLHVHLTGANVHITGGVYNHNSGNGIAWRGGDYDIGELPPGVTGQKTRVRQMPNGRVIGADCNFNFGAGITTSGGYKVIGLNNVYTSGHGNAPCYEMIFANNQCNYNGAYGIIAQAQQITIGHNTCDNNGPQGGRVAGINCTCEDILLIGNTVQSNSAWGIDVGGSINGLLTGNHVRRNLNPITGVGTGINLGACVYIRCANNFVYDQTFSINCSLNDQGTEPMPNVASDITIDNNDIISFSELNWGIFVTGHVSNVAITNNRFKWLKLDGTPAQDGKQAILPGFLTGTIRGNTVNGQSYDTLNKTNVADGSGHSQGVVQDWAEQVIADPGPYFDIRTNHEDDTPGKATAVFMTNMGTGYVESTTTVTSTSVPPDGTVLPAGTVLPDGSIAPTGGVVVVCPQYKAKVTRDGKVAFIRTTPDTISPSDPRGGAYLTSVAVTINSPTGTGATAVVQVGWTVPDGKTIVIASRRTATIPVPPITDPLDPRSQWGDTFGIYSDVTKVNLNIPDGQLQQWRDGAAVTLRWQAGVLGVVASNPLNPIIGGDLMVVGKMGFNNNTPLTKPAITGSRAGNVALANLLTALQQYGLITNSTTA